MHVEDKIWANSGDSHFLEPGDLFRQRLPGTLADRMPRTVKSEDGTRETVYVDGASFERPLPRPIREGEFKGETISTLSSRPPGASDTRERLKDLDQEGIWGEVTYPSLGLWANMIRDPLLMREACRALNDWAKEEIQDVAPDRLVATAMLPLLDVSDAVAEAHRARDRGYHAVYLPTAPPGGQPSYNQDYWEPLWAALEQRGLILTIHIGTDGPTVVYRGPGGALLNYVETTYGGQRVATQLIAGGALDRHPALKVLISEGGAAWAPFLGDRMNEGYRQHGMFVRPKLSMLPKEYVYRQVYVSFQHDETAVQAAAAMGYRNVMFGSDYPHLEGTYGHTQKTLHELFDGADPAIRHRVTVGAFLDLFPHIGEPPEALTSA
jgi:predicted TIM-barrel fold metal-dependent hydrolase